MKKNLPGFIIVFIILLSACTPAAVTPKAEPSAALTSTSVQVVTKIPAATPTHASTVQPTIEFTASAPADCVPVPVVPLGDAMIENNVPPVTDLDWKYGTKTPKITIISYCNYQNPVCSQLATSLAELQVAYKEDVLIVFRPFVQTDGYDKSMLAAQAAQGAGAQNRFWEMNNILLTKYADWINLSSEEFITWLTDQAETIGIKRSQFKSDFESADTLSGINQILENAKPLAITETPVLFFNGIQMGIRVDLDSLKSVVKYFSLPEIAYSECPAMAIDPAKQYTATLKTEKGDIVFKLYPKIAPVAVNSFVFLARNGWFDKSTFYRVIPGFVVQAGDPSGSGLGTPGYAFSNEVDPSLRFTKAGVLAMANKGEGTNGSQFFITYTELPEFDGKYTIFGQVISGMDVLTSLRPRNPAIDQILLPAEPLLSVTIEEN